MVRRIIYRIYITLLKIRLSFKKGIIIHHTVKINRHTVLEGMNKLYKDVNISGSYVGRGSYISNNSSFRNVKIGRYCSIGQNVTCGMGLHPTSGFISTHPAFFSLKKQAGFTYVSEQLFEEHKYVDESKYFVKIGNDVWIGNNVLIMDGVVIGDGAIIGSGAVVTKDVDDYAIVVGVPAKLVRYRFDKGEIKRLIESQWWHSDPKFLNDNKDLFTNVDDFFNNVKQTLI